MFNITAPKTVTLLIYNIFNNYQWLASTAPPESIQNKTAFRADVQKLGISNFFQLNCRAREVAENQATWAPSDFPELSSQPTSFCTICSQSHSTATTYACTDAVSLLRDGKATHWNSLICNSHNLNSLRTFACAAKGAAVPFSISLSHSVISMSK